jgi:7-cyano-7-deazaguanine synthase
MKPAVVLLSGGLDSATASAIARSEGFPLHALSFRYGQRHGIEPESAARVAESLGVVEHAIVDAGFPDPLGRRFGFVAP